MRYFIMHRHGGVYVDLDFEALRPLDNLLAGEELVLGWEPEAHVVKDPAVRSRRFTSILGNAFLASRPGHPFWEAVFEGLVSYREQPHVLDATGPFLLTRVYREYPCASHVTIVPSELLYPITKWEAWSGALEERGINAEPSSLMKRTPCITGAACTGARRSSNLCGGIWTEAADHVTRPRLSCEPVCGRDSRKPRRSSLG